MRDAEDVEIAMANRILLLGCKEESNAAYHRVIPAPLCITMLQETNYD
jgi:hypothetical protein